MSDIDELLNKREFNEAYDLLMENHSVGSDTEEWNRKMVICGYYVDKQEEARKAIDRIMFQNQWNRDICIANMQWYTTDIRKYATLINFSNEALSEFSEVANGEMRKSFFPSNPSIFKHEQGYIVNIRFITYYIHNGSYIQTSYNNTIDTENALIFYDNNLVEQRRIKIKDMREKYYTYIRGIEDMRITSYDPLNNTVGFIGTVVDYQPVFELVMPRMLVGKINTLTGNVISSYLPKVKREGQCEKNWVPILNDNDGTYAYMFHNKSIELVTPDKDKFISHNIEQTMNLSGLRCSTQFVRGEGGKYYTITHEVYGLSQEEPHKRRYIHRFLELDDKLQVLRCSSPFKYSNEGIQYIAGLCYDNINNRFLFTGSVNDRDARMYSITYSNLDKLLSKTI